MQFHTDAIGKEFLSKEGERAESHGARFHFFEIAVANEAIYFVRIMPLRLEA